MARLKVTAYIDVECIPEEYLDYTDPSGLSNVGFEAMVVRGGWVEMAIEDVETSIEYEEES